MISPDLLGQDFTAQEPNRRWVGDITYLETSTGFEYLATVIDLFSRRVVGWALAPTLETPVVIAALDMALRQRRPPPGLIFHSDRGCQYTSQAFRDRLRLSAIEQSMSRSGCCYDIACDVGKGRMVEVRLVRKNARLGRPMKHQGPTDTMG